MEFEKDWPSVSFIVCTLNCKDNVIRCFDSINKQDYPRDRFEILALDGGSTDGTIEAAKEFGARVIHNPAQYPEGRGRGKWLGFLKANGEIVIFIDSDNKLVEDDWIKKMVKPLMENKADFCICRMAVVKSDKLINRYLSLMGTDPFVSFCSIDSLLGLKKLKLKDMDNFYLYNITPENFIITGGYYFAVKKQTLEKIGGYTQDTDVVYNLAKNNMGRVGIPKDAHVHHLISDSIINFTGKKIWWAEAYFTKQYKDRDFDYGIASDKPKLLFTTIKNFLFIPEAITGIEMCLRDKESAWLLHPVMSWLVTYAYLVAFVKSKLGLRIF